MPDETNNLATVLTFAGGILTVTIPLIFNHWRKKDIPPIEQSDYEVRFCLEELVEIHDEVEKLIAHTKLDRFLILKAENGKSSPKWATAIYEQHRGTPVIAATTAYRKVKIDDHYREMIVTAEQEDKYEITTSAMPSQSRLKAIYEVEGVTHSICYFICRYPLKSDSNKWAVFYFTVATKSETGFTAHEETTFRLFGDWLRDLFGTEVESKRA